MKRVALLFTFSALAGCAHAPARAPRVHAPVALRAVAGVEEGQASLLESALCQGLVEGNGGDVNCPEANRQAIELARLRALATSDTRPADALVEAIQGVDQQVSAEVKQVGSAWTLSLVLADRTKKDASPMASERVEAGSFEALVMKAPAAARALVQ